MKHLLVASFVLFCMGSSQAQFGFRGQMVQASIPAASSTSTTNSGLSHWGYDLGAHYWMRLKEHRVEFYPELSFAKFSRTEPVDASDRPIDMNRYGISVPISIYPLDFRGDCDCPTFSKQNDLFKKGFFLQLVPSFFQVHSNYGDPTTAKSWKSQAGIGIGAGLDIGLSDLLTISPMVHYFHHFYEGGSDLDGPGVAKELRMGIRVAFRPDYL